MSTPLKLGIAGLGTVGIGLINIFEKHGDIIEAKAGRSIIIKAVSARNKSADRGADLSAYQWFDDAAELAVSPDIDVYVELIGGEEGIAHTSVEAALKAGKHVVTANKALLAHHGSKLAQLAEDHNVALNYEAAVAGGIPIVKTMRESLTGNEVSRISGILNGTCNYILSLMEQEGRPFAEILKDAQDEGFAEADPTTDIGGFDAAHKLALLTSLAYGTQPSFKDVYIEGIESITSEDIAAAGELGYRIKLLGTALKTDSGIEQRVHPAMIKKQSPIAEVGGVTNCVAVNGDFVGDVMLVGPGAGAGPTASSVMGDLIDIARKQIVPPFIRPAGKLKPYSKAKMRAHEGGYYVRLDVVDQIGVLAAIATHMADKKISLKSIVQKEDVGDQKNGATIVMITHDTLESSMREALDAIKKDGHLVGTPQMIRIETL